MAKAEIKGVKHTGLDPVTFELWVGGEKVDNVIVSTQLSRVPIFYEECWHWFFEIRLPEEDVLAEKPDGKLGFNYVPSFGDYSECTMCRKKIRYNGNYWDHVDGAYRHPATPKKERSKDVEN